jgi:hypothetical protein
MRRRRHRNFSPETSKDEVVNLMVDFWERTGKLFTGKKPLLLEGTPEEILEKIEAVVDGRWCRQASYEYQANELRRALRRIELKKEIDEVQLK